MTKNEVTAQLIDRCLADSICVSCVAGADHCYGCLVVRAIDDTDWLQRQRQQTAKERDEHGNKGR